MKIGVRPVATNFEMSVWRNKTLKNMVKYGKPGLRQAVNLDDTGTIGSDQTKGAWMTTVRPAPFADSPCRVKFSVALTILTRTMLVPVTLWETWPGKPSMCVGGFTPLPNPQRLNDVWGYDLFNRPVLDPIRPACYRIFRPTNLAAGRQGPLDCFDHPDWNSGLLGNWQPSSPLT